MKIAVSGASGHVGGNLCRELLRRGHHVKALIHKNNRSLHGLDLETVPGDVGDKESLKRLCEGAEVVFHLAALISIAGERKRLESTNVNGTRNLLEAVKDSGVRRLVHFSSIHALDNFPLDQPMDENRPLVSRALMMYESTKADGDRMVQEAMKKGLDAVIINPTAIIGPHDYQPSLVGQVIIRLYNGSLPALVPGGYDWVDVRDVVDGAIAAMEKGKKGDRFILSGEWLSVSGFAGMLEEVTGKRMVRMKLPVWLAKAGVPFIKLYSLAAATHPLYTFQSLDVLTYGNRMINPYKAKSELGYAPRPLRHTLADTVEWFKENGYLK